MLKTADAEAVQPHRATSVPLTHGCHILGYNSKTTSRRRRPRQRLLSVALIWRRVRGTVGLLCKVMLQSNDLNPQIWLILPAVRGALLATTLGLLLPFGSARAQSNGIAVLDFDIPAQSLARSLEAYSTVTGIVAVYNGNLALGRQAVRVRGHYSPETALRFLLRGSGLLAQYTARDAFVLTLAPTSIALRTPATIAQAALARQGAAERRYSGLVQAHIARSLCAEQETRPGDYRLAISFWIGSSGEVTKLRLLSSTGDQPRDAAITEVLGRLQSIGEPPPPSMAQPFTMIVLPRSSGGAVDCPPAPVGNGRND
jgi:hypothetical protein